MKRRRTLAGLLLLLVPLAACQLILGIGDDNFYSVKEAGVDSSDPDPCLHAGPPPRNPQAPVGEQLRPLFFAFRTADIAGRNDSGAVVGFDLDGICTCDDRDGSAEGGRQTCQASANASRANNCDEDGGIDNGMVRIFDQFKTVDSKEVQAIPGEFNRQIECGHQGLIFVLASYNGLADDDHVLIYPFQSNGIRNPHRFDGGFEGGELEKEFAGTDCDVNELDGAKPAYPAVFDGKDLWSVPTGGPQTPDAFPKVPPTEAWVKDWHLVVDDRGKAGAFPLVFGPKIIFAEGSVMRVRLQPVDGPGGKDIVVPEGGKATAFRMADGLVGGRIPVSDLLDAIGKAKLAGGVTPSPKDFLCNNPFLYAALKAVVCESADSVGAGREFLNVGCDSITMGVQFEATMATYGEIYDPTSRAIPCDPSMSTLCP